MPGLHGADVATGVPHRVTRRRRGDGGASAVEYGLLVAGIAAVVLVLVFTLGASVRDTLFGASCAALQAEIQALPADGTCA